MFIIFIHIFIRIVENVKPPELILKEAREQKGLTQTELGDKIGLGLRAYQKLEDGIFPKFKKEHITNLDKILGTQLYEQIYAHGNPSAIQRKKPNLVALRSGNVEGGTNISIQDSPDYIEGYVQVDGIGPNDGSWVVSGHSMHPTISKGCRVVIRKLENLDVIVWNEIYVVDLKEHGAKVKRLKPGKKKGSYVLVSDNKEYDPFEVTLEKDILGIYRVLMVFEMF